MDKIEFIRNHIEKLDMKNNVVNFLNIMKCWLKKIR